MRFLTTRTNANEVINPRSLQEIMPFPALANAAKHSHKRRYMSFPALGRVPGIPPSAKAYAGAIVPFCRHLQNAVRNKLSRRLEAPAILLPAFMEALPAFGKRQPKCSFPVFLVIFRRSELLLPAFGRRRHRASTGIWQMPAKMLFAGVHRAFTGIWQMPAKMYSRSAY